VDRHGTESYFVVGEGLLTESAGGRTLASAGDAAPFRFSRMGPSGAGRQLAEAARRKLAAAMTVGGGGAGPIPAGYTYLGQFVDHDLTFDKTQVTLGQNVSPAQLLQARSPSLDLDSLYGGGPADPLSAKFYADGVRMKVGDTVATPPDGAKKGFDLPRVGAGSAAAKRKAQIPDPRNDENLAVAQTHLAFIRFHNRVVAGLPPSTPQAQRFAKARELVIKHYQWMLRTDFLPRICEKAIVDAVFKHGRKAFEPNAGPMSVPTMPLEFSVAAFRLGHSMIREDYSWNRRFDDGSGTLDLLFAFSAGGGDLGGGERLPSNWICDFRRLYNFRQAGRDDLAVPPAKFNRAMRLDTRMANLLKNLPTGSFGGPAVPFDDPRASLAFRNLTRAKMVNLATGQQLVSFLKKRGVTVKPLTAKEIRDGANGAKLDSLTAAQREHVVKNTPLWFYVLREAELNGGKLRGVGARIVAETFHRAMEGSEHSIVRDPAWKPTLGPSAATFRMVDLLLVAFEGKKALLNPLGG
jgi:hypothetical protein